MVFCQASSGHTGEGPAYFPTATAEASRKHYSWILYYTHEKPTGLPSLSSGLL